MVTFENYVTSTLTLLLTKYFLKWVKFSLVSIVDRLECMIYVLLSTKNLHVHQHVTDLKIKI